MVEKLTEALLKGLTPPACGERYVYDAEVTGFAVRLFASTKANPKGARTFVLVYRCSGGLRRFRIGSWPDWSVTAARAEAKEIRRRVDRGEDPARERLGRREAPTMLDLAERYKQEHLSRIHRRHGCRRRRLCAPSLASRPTRRSALLLDDTVFELQAPMPGAAEQAARHAIASRPCPAFQREGSGDHRDGLAVVPVEADYGEIADYE